MRVSSTQKSIIIWWKNRNKWITSMHIISHFAFLLRSLRNRRELFRGDVTINFIVLSNKSLIHMLSLSSILWKDGCLMKWMKLISSSSSFIKPILIKHLILTYLSELMWKLLIHKIAPFCCLNAFDTFELCLPSFVVVVLLVVAVD